MTNSSAFFDTLILIAETVGVITILTGLIFGWLHIRHLREQHDGQIATNLMKTFYNSDLAHAVAILRTLPDGISAEELRNKGAEYEAAAMIVSATFETMGLLVFRKVASFDLVVDLAGGMVKVMARKLSSWINTTREEQQQPSYAEWFEWLALQVQTVKAEDEPAYVRYKNWKR
jgi:hypothetical protein